MTPVAARRLMLALPGATANVQWGEDHVFKVGGKMFAVIGMRSGKYSGMSFKCAPDSFAILTQLPGLRPAPYLARAHWVALERLDALPEGELAAYLKRAYEIVRAGLPRKLQAALGTPASPTSRRPSATRPARRASSGR
jgi:predicted DNA-binding protein (MmcQ/YjbR family)